MFRNRRIARSLAALLAISALQTISGIQAPYSFAAAGTVGPTTASGTCVSSVGETTYVTATFVNNAFCLIKVSTSTSWTVPSGVNTIDILVVGGGGGGGSDGGGGGGGGEVRTATGISVSAGIGATVTVGTGGIGNIHGQTNATNGNTSSLVINGTTYSAGGGLKSVNWQAAAYYAPGGSGGTGGTQLTGATDYSKGGRNSVQNDGYAAGGYGTVGYAGVTTSFTGTSTVFAGGGGGGICTNTKSEATFGGLAGGAGGGGRGALHTQNYGSDAGQPGTNGLGGGGGGGSACNDGLNDGVTSRTAGGRGGDGVVYIKFVPVPAVSTNPTSTTAEVGSTATFTAATQGTIAGATRSVKWQVLTPGGSWTDIPGATSDTYVTPAATRAMHGNQYRYVTTDTVGTISSTSYSTAATLSVTSPYQSETDTALTFSSTGKYAEVADTAGSPFDTTGTFTMEAWVNPSDSCSSAGAVIAKLSYMLYCNSGYWYVMALANGSTGSGVSTSIPIEPNEWHHIAATKTSSSGNILFYYDGILVNTVASGATTMTPNDHAFQIGRWDNNAAYWFQGQIDEVRIYNSQRTQSQIASDMKSYGGVNDSDLMAYYDFNEGTGTALYNRKTGATAGTDLTITGSPTWADVKITDTTTLPAYTIVKFPRTYLTVNGGWKVPANIPKVSALVIAGGGGGGARAAGGGGAGGLVYRTVLTLTSGSIETITIGQGGLGGYSVPSFTTRQGINGQDSQMGSHTVALGGGGGGGAGDAGNTYRVGLNGGSGGGASGDSAGNGSSAAFGYGQQNSSKGYGLGNNGGSGVSGSYWNGGGGGGSGGAGSNSSTTSWVAGNGGAGTLDPVGGSNLCLAAGGGGGTINGGTSAGTGGTCGSGTVTAGAGTIGAVVAGSATANSGSGGGGSGYNTSDVGGGHGGSGVIIVRWITAATPTYTKPTNAYLNVGMTETFTTNVAQDSATANLTRTFRWESSTTGVNGTYSLIKQGTGAANASFAWVPADTATSGSTFAYRVIVTDSDTAGLFIIDTSTPVWAVINKALLVTGNSSISKAINVARNETFTIQFGTSTFRPTLAPNIPGISIDTSTAGIAVIKIADTVTVGTYFETLTVIDSVSASFTLALTIIVTAPPNLLNTGEISTNGLVLNLDAGNSASVIAPDGSAITNIDIKDLAGSKKNAVSGSTYESQPCANPTYTASNGGALVFNGTSQCAYVPYLGSNFDKSITLETWVKMPTGFSTGSSIFTQNDASTTSDINIVLGGSGYAAAGLRFQFRAGGASPTWPRPTNAITVVNDTWMHIVGTYDGSNMKVYVNNVQTDTYTTSVGLAGGAYANTNGYFIGVGWDTTGGSHYFTGSIASIRIYNRAISATEVSQNYNSTMTRFQTSNVDWLYPSQKYGSLSSESYTATSGYGARTTTFAIGDRAGIDWDTSTAVNQVKLSIQESLTVGTYNDTVTVTDALGQSTYLPIKVTIAKADTITVTLRNPKTLTYTGSPAALVPDISIVGLKSSDTGTVTRLYSAPASLPGSPETYTALVNSSVVPTDVESYTVTSSALTLSVGLLSNYESVTYESSSLIIVQAKQPGISVSPYGAYVGAPYTVVVIGGAGGGLISETVTAGSTASGCAVTNHVLTMTSTFQSYCSLDIAKAASRNYLRETATVQVYFFSLTINQPAPAPSSGPGVALSGATAITLDPNQAPTISSLSVSSGRVGDTVIITGAGFTASTLQSVKFWRNFLATVTGTTTNTQITVIVPAGATSGKILVTTANGLAITEGSFTVLP